MSTLKLETYVPRAGVNKPKSKFGLAWDRLTKPAEEPPYRPLAEHFIRVAKIKPGTKSEPLRIKLKHVDSRSTKYIALSYTWDQSPLPTADLTRNSSSESQSTLPGTEIPDKPQTTTLLCGGTNFRVRQNLYDALCQIRDVQCDVPVFVDALCVDFNDNVERSKHLEIMGHIYARAASVIVYLGPKSPGADSTMLIMRQLVNAIDWRRIGDAVDGSPGAYNFRDPHFFQNIGMEPLTLKQWRAIRDFCRLRWFTRYWAFFELALAKDALFLWGEACMEYKFLIDFCMILTMSGWLDELREIGNDNLLSSTFHADENVPLIKMLMPVSQLRSTPPWSPKNQNFAAWMEEYHGLQSEHARAWQFFEILLQVAEPFECLNPLDRMYAPLTFANAMYAGKVIGKVWPKPDYQRSVADVYGEFAERVASETGNHSIIAGMEGYTGPAPRVQLRTENSSRTGHRDSSRDPGPNKGRNKARTKHESANEASSLHAADSSSTRRNEVANDTRSVSTAAFTDTRRHEATNQTRAVSATRDKVRPISRDDDPRSRTVNSTKPLVAAEYTDSRRNEIMHNTGPIPEGRDMDGSIVSDEDPRFRIVNGTRFKNNFGQSRSSTPDRDVPSKEPNPRIRNGKLVSKRAPSRNGWAHDEAS